MVWQDLILGWIERGRKMLIPEAEICFDTQNDSPSGLPYDLSTGNIIRPAINFGNDMLSSGTILTNNKIDVIKRGLFYNVIIEMPTIETEAYAEIKHLLRCGSNFKIQAASRIIGKGRILDFSYD